MTPEEELKKCQTEREEYLNGWKRAKADFINYQKDEAKHLEEIARFGQWDLVREIITVLDSFDLATKHNASDTQAIRLQLENILKKRGLEMMTAAVGQPFDPALHEAVGDVESDEPAGTIVEEVERGYILNGRVIRPARVKIAKQ